MLTTISNSLGYLQDWQPSKLFLEIGWYEEQILLSFLAAPFVSLFLIAKVIGVSIDLEWCNSVGDHLYCFDTKADCEASSEARACAGVSSDS